MKFMMIRRALGSATRQTHTSASKETIKPSSPSHIFSSEIIKPSSPTPSHLKTYRFNSMDQFTTRRYIPLLLFYHNNGSTKTAENIRNLKSSLAQSLTQYYPFAGKLIGGPTLDCNDDGVEFMEAKINCGLSEILENPEHEAMDQVCPEGSVWGDPYERSGSPAMVQLNHFDCGGIGLSLSLAHKLGDGLTLSNFLNYWSAVARQSGEQVLPYFAPTSQDLPTVEEIEIGPMTGGVTKRFVFSNSKIAQLKDIVSAQGINNPTRVQVVTALIFKSALAAATEKNSGSFIPSMLFQFVNMRPKMATPLPSTALGNFYSNITTLVSNESETELGVLADQISKAKLQIKSGLEHLDGNECYAKIGDCIGKNAEMYMCTSLCRFPFSQLDFGWGNPAWVTMREVSLKNLIIMMDTPNGDGIEALVNLDTARMPLFEQDKDILAFTS